MEQQKRKGYNSNRSYYQKRAKPFSLDTGMTGFLGTCNFREKECIRDAYKILEEFANDLYGSESSNTGDAKSDKNKAETLKVEGKDIDEKKDNDDEEEEDISEALNKEIKELKAENKKSAVARRFQNAQPGVKNVIFISTTLPDPLELVLSIIKKLDESKAQRTRYLLRLLPIQVVCKANMTDIKAKADLLFEKYFAQEPKTFSIVFNRHSNNNISRNEIIEELADLIAKKNPGNKADLKSPEIAVVVEIIRGFCLFSIAPDYFKYKKYNLMELCNVKEPEKPQNDAEEESPKPNGDAAKLDVKETDEPAETIDNEKLEVETTKEAADTDASKQDEDKEEEEVEPKATKPDALETEGVEVDQA